MNAPEHPLKWLAGMALALLVGLFPLQAIAGNPCGAHAPQMEMDSTLICLVNEQATLTATSNDQAEVPAGFELAYLLSTTNGLLIEQVSSAPTFTVNEAGIWRIHSLVYDPTTLDPAVIIPGTTYIYHLSAMLMQGGGAICASLTMNGAFVKTGDCGPPPCEAVAGHLSLSADTVCYHDGMASAVATAQGDAVIPDGFNLVFLLAHGEDDAVIAALAPGSFTVYHLGTYHVHALVYDPTTLDPEHFVSEATTLAQLEALLVQGGGTICGSLDTTGAVLEVIDCVPECLADAGAMVGGGMFCLDSSSVVIEAVSFGDTVVPAGFGLRYLLSGGNGGMILAISDQPRFTITQPGAYRIHAFVSATDAPGPITVGSTTILALHAALIQGGGELCASLDVLGAGFVVENCTPLCAGAGTGTSISVCISAPPFNLFDFVGGSPCPDGTWIGPFAPMEGSTFNPAIHAPGSYMYIASNGAGVVDTAIVTITIVECLHDTPQPMLDVMGHDQTTGVDGTGASPAEHMRLWPNPAVSVLHISLPFPWVVDGTRVELLDAAGRVVQVPPRIAGDHLLLNVAALDRGLWTIRISNGHQAVHGRFVR